MTDIAKLRELAQVIDGISANFWVVIPTLEIVEESSLNRDKMIIVSRISQGPFCDAWPMQTDITLTYLDEYGFEIGEETIPLTKDIVNELKNKWVCSKFMLDKIDSIISTLP